MFTYITITEMQLQLYEQPFMQKKYPYKVVQH